MITITFQFTDIAAAAALLAKIDGTQAAVVTTGAEAAPAPKPAKPAKPAPAAVTAPSQPTAELRIDFFISVPYSNIVHHVIDIVAVTSGIGSATGIW